MKTRSTKGVMVDVVMMAATEVVAADLVRQVAAICCQRGGMIAGPQKTLANAAVARLGAGARTVTVARDTLAAEVPAAANRVVVLDAKGKVTAVA